MSRHISDGDRDLWNEMQRDAAPDVKMLHDKVSVARRGHELSCGCFIFAGERYRSVAMIADGKFERSKEHAYWEECRLVSGGKMQERFDAEHQRRSDEYARAMNEEAEAQGYGSTDDGAENG